ncbi:MAG: hypothetical protein WBA74_19795 [Cyclobacteriaceae bacterium]
MKRLLLLLFVLMLSSQTIVSAQNEAYTHDGFFVNLGLGLNFGTIKTEIENVNSFKFTGAGTSLDLLIGVSPVENIILHATIFGTGTANPKVDVNGTAQGNIEDTGVGTGMFGLGATFYTKDNFFLSPSIGRSIITLENDSETIVSGGGLGVLLRAGKEWWVGKQWGVGFSIAYRGAFGVTDLGQGEEEEWSSSNFSIALSTTFN